ncbi:MAG: hypothetical protein HeimC2_15760 [Candidatus Heimdallarchaeota archaeon LC_2]|nr:MAG: hypothetical protein HeimC2_15760 [Candidatus Heimdallarchaeota archaeon LC_2]
MNFVSTTTERVKSRFLSKLCVFFANFREEGDPNEVRRVLILFALMEYGEGLFKDTVSETSNYEAPFMVLDVVLWVLTIVLLVPIIVDRLSRPKDREDTQMLAFSVSFFAFFLTWIFNYQILRIFIQLPLGRDV